MLPKLLKVYMVADILDQPVYSPKRDFGTSQKYIILIAKKKYINAFGSHPTKLRLFKHNICTYNSIQCGYMMFS